ncbi:MAG: SMI1/KNR4 family protein [Lachnospiraceae bacterium]|nr:SMI1/KNR4 family protein [Lachnospiraceae bacterium]
MEKKDVIRNSEWNMYVEKLCEKMPYLRETLREGASAEDIRAAETETGCQFPDLLKGLYLTNDGDNAEALCGMLLGFHFLSLEAMRSEWRRSYANTKWIPIGSDGGGNFIGVDLENGTNGQVISFGRDEEGKTVLAENLGELFARFTRIVCSEDFYIGEYDDEQVIVLGTDDVEEGSYLTDYLKSEDSVK